ncbi:DUF4870 domain-containing protein [Flavobacterium sp. 102]|uniref:DUF4870 domain-containing protein n=1 Tax=Flavobacterium sp. 102 TaxID=2135623 RepID=UPI000EACAED9|nr:DUF4870 domain-containing protein [Flavobacterium sp. 102]RKS03306.1 hypothetical protein C8C84_3052 [Flavobacterium sp. 102]
MTTTNEKSVATFLHLSVLTQYFIPFGNYIFPIVIWSAKKNESEFVDANGKNVLNFQLSMFLYTIVLCLIAIPILIYSIFKNVPLNDINFDRHFVIENLSAGNITGLTILGIVAVLLFCFLKVIEFVLIIYAAVKASNDEAYKYPLSIPFFK